VHLKWQFHEKQPNQTSLKHALCKSSPSVVTMQGGHWAQMAACSWSSVPGGYRQRRKEAPVCAGKGRQMAVEFVEMWGWSQQLFRPSEGYSECARPSNQAVLLLLLLASWKLPACLVILWHFNNHESLLCTCMHFILMVVHVRFVILLITVF
jgi:hypothetical protein